jgi:hypothetical protein
VVEASACSPKAGTGLAEVGVAAELTQPKRDPPGLKRAGFAKLLESNLEKRCIGDGTQRVTDLDQAVAS